MPVAVALRNGVLLSYVAVSSGVYLHWPTVCQAKLASQQYPDIVQSLHGQLLLRADSSSTGSQPTNTAHAAALSPEVREAAFAELTGCFSDMFADGQVCLSSLSCWQFSL